MCWLCLCVHVCVCVSVPAHAALAWARAAWRWRRGLIGPAVIWPLQILNHLRVDKSLLCISLHVFCMLWVCVCVYASPVHWQGAVCEDRLSAQWGHQWWPGDEWSLPAWRSLHSKRTRLKQCFTHRALNFFIHQQYVSPCLLWQLQDDFLSPYCHCLYVGITQALSHFV